MRKMYDYVAFLKIYGEYNPDVEPGETADDWEARREYGRVFEAEELLPFDDRPPIPRSKRSDPR